MRQRQRVAYAGIVDTGAVTVLGLAGLFIEQHGRVVTTRPMKGTAPRAEPRSRTPRPGACSPAT